MERGSVIVAGFGFTRRATVDSLASALARAEGPAPQTIATLADKAASPAFQGLADHLGLAVRRVADAAAAKQVTPTTSAASLSARGITSVAEACALAAAGPGARLLAPRALSQDGQATCALAEADLP